MKKKKKKIEETKKNIEERIEIDFIDSNFR